jgi:hypothetical protein
VGPPFTGQGRSRSVPARSPQRQEGDWKNFSHSPQRQEGGWKNFSRPPHHSGRGLGDRQVPPQGQGRSWEFGCAALNGEDGVCGLRTRRPDAEEGSWSFPARSPDGEEGDRRNFPRPQNGCGRGSGNRRGCPRGEGPVPGARRRRPHREGGFAKISRPSLSCEGDESPGSMDVFCFIPEEYSILGRTVVMRLACSEAGSP